MCMHTTLLVCCTCTVELVNKESRCVSFIQIKAPSIVGGLYNLKSMGMGHSLYKADILLCSSPLFGPSKQNVLYWEVGLLYSICKQSVPRHLYPSYIGSLLFGGSTHAGQFYHDLTMCCMTVKPAVLYKLFNFDLLIDASHKVTSYIDMNPKVG